MDAAQMVDGDLMIVPYVEINGYRTIGDDKLTLFYNDLIQQNILSKLFRESKIKSGDEFIKVMKNSVNVVVFVCQGESIIGAAWLNQIKDNHAFAHFGFLKQAWGDTAIQVGKMILNYWFDFPGGQKGSFLFDVICGNTPSDNANAIRFIKKLGFTVIGEIPMIYRVQDKDDTELLIGATLSYLTREKFYGLGPD